MGETTPPPDDRFPKVFSMTSAAYQPAGARGGFAKQQQKEATPMAEENKEKGEENRRNATGDGAVEAEDERAKCATATAAAAAEGDVAKSATTAADSGTAGATVKDEAVIDEATAAERKGGRDQSSGAEVEQGSCKAIEFISKRLEI